MNYWYRTTIAACVLASAALASLAATSDGLMAFTACVDNDDPPFSAASSPDRGVDVEIAQAIAGRVGRPLRLVWVQVPVRGGLEKALKQTIEAGQCDAYFGIPSGADMALELSEHRLVATRPYLTVGYLFVSAPGSKPATAADVRRARRVGAVTATPADLHLHEQQFNRRPYANNPALIAALQAGEIDIGLIWSPALAADAARSAGLVPAIDPPGDLTLRTGLTVAMRRADAAMTKAVEAAVDGLRTEGVFERIAAQYNLLTWPNP